MHLFNGWAMREPSTSAAISATPGYTGEPGRGRSARRSLTPPPPRPSSLERDHSYGGSRPGIPEVCHERTLKEMSSSTVRDAPSGPRKALIRPVAVSTAGASTVAFVGTGMVTPCPTPLLASPRSDTRRRRGLGRAARASSHTGDDLRILGSSLFHGVSAPCAQD